MLQIRFPAVRLKLTQLSIFLKLMKAASDVAATDKGAFRVAFAFGTPLCSCWGIIWNDGYQINKNEPKQWNLAPRHFRHIQQGWCTRNQNVLLRYYLWTKLRWSFFLFVNISTNLRKKSPMSLERAKLIPPDTNTNALSSPGIMSLLEVTTRGVKPAFSSSCFSSLLWWTGQHIRNKISREPRRCFGSK